MIDNNLKTFLVGALTSKPYAFTARSWELRNTESIDVFDSMGSTIKLSTRGSSILRVLPKINDLINEEWITDKVRFSYDALKFQRVVYCFKKQDKSTGDNRFYKINWNKVFSFLLNSELETEEVTQFNKVSSVGIKGNTYRNLNFFTGSFVDFQTLEYISVLKKNLDLDVKIYNSNSGLKNVDNRDSYIFKNFDKLNNFKTCLLIGCNLRYEAPILNLKFRKNVTSKSMFVYNIGHNNVGNFSIKNIGNSIKHIKLFLEGKSRFNLKVRDNTDTMMVVVGNSFISCQNSYNILSLIKNKIKNTNILQSESSFINLHEIGLETFLRPSNTYNKHSSISWFLDDDKTKLLGLGSTENNYSVYQGHHNDFNFNNSDLVLPSTVFSEKSGTYINFSGLVQETKFVDSKILNTSVRDDTSILSNLNDGLSNKYKKSLVYYSESSTPKKNLFVYDIKDNTKSRAKTLSKFDNTSVFNYMEDFYRNDSITRNSPVMALVSNRINSKTSSFKSN